MTEYRPDASPPGLYAKRSFNLGDTILDEAPIIVFRPSPDEEGAVTAQLRTISSDGTASPAAPSRTSRKNRAKGKKSRAAAVKFAPSMDDIPPPPGLAPAYVGKFRGMVTAAATYAVAVAASPMNESWKQRIFDLYAPDLESPGPDEKEAVFTARAALKYCRQNAVEGSSLSRLISSGGNECLKIMLIWSCNAFEGGALYEMTSRVNHSCNPNAIVRESSEVSGAGAKSQEDSTKPGNQQLVAASSIRAGEEIFISYLGIFVYAAGSIRLDQLRKSKHFTCHCNRCNSTDQAAAVPCPSCHPRVNGRYLDEEVQYDDEKAVHYAYPKNAESSTQSFRCRHCHDSCNAAGQLTLVAKVSDKVTDRFVGKSSDDGRNTDSDAANAEHEIDGQLFHLASSVLGARHWTTNLVALSILERQLSAIHSATLMGEAAPDLTELAECIDTLQRLWDFVGDLDLHLDPGHLLSGPTIGVARALVSLGDIKSRKYAAQWVKKVEAYVRAFEGEGMRKVVESLIKAWERDDLEEVAYEEMAEALEEKDLVSNKRARTS